MSLKAFHLFFVTVSVILCLGVGAWGVRGFLDGRGGMPLTLGIVCLVSSFVLILYGFKVREKLKSLGNHDV